MNDDVKTLIQISASRGLSHQEEKVILEYLKSIPEREALEIFKYMIEQKSLTSLSIAKRVLRTKDHVKSLFKYGVVNSNAQSIKQWLEFAIPQLGFKSSVYLIEQLNNENNRLIDKALYWLPMFISENDTKSRSILDKLREKVKDPESMSDK